jgi:hypothetical protein
MPAETAARLAGEGKLSDEDQAAMIESARKAIQPFLPHAEAGKRAQPGAP